MGNPPLSLPDMYFVIDESDSMIIKDSAGEPCDPTGLRYDIPLFIAQILKNWAEQGIANVPKLYLLLNDEQAKAQIPASITPDQMIEKLKDRHSHPPKSKVQPFDAAKSPDAIQAVFGMAKNNDYVFLFTDGDFRINRYEDDPYDPKAYRTSLNIIGLFENSLPHPKTFVFLLSTRRIESKNNWFIKQTWKDRADKQQASVYGLESEDFHDKTVLSNLISKMLSALLSDWNSGTNRYATRGWGWFVPEDRNLSPVSNVIPDLLRLRYGAISFDKGILSMDANSTPTIRVQVDGGPVPMLDTRFPDRIDDFISPAGQCSPHELEFDDTAMDDYTFYWWWADTPIYSTEATKSIVFYNDENENYTFNITADSSLKGKGSEFLKPDDLDKLSRCLSFYATLDDKKIDLEYQDGGKLLLENKRNPFSDESTPLPYGNGIVSLAIHGNWSSNQQPLFCVDLLRQSENTKRAKVRYYPVIGNRFSLPTTPTPVSQEIRLQIPLDFFEEKYYPPSIFPEESRQPSVVFAGNGCPPALTTPVEPPYRPSGGQAAVFDVKTIQARESGLEIKIDTSLIDGFNKCNKLILSWDQWPRGIQDWQTPPIIELTCTLTTTLAACQ
jgi:hypothetical protein